MCVYEDTDMVPLGFKVLNGGHICVIHCSFFLVLQDVQCTAEFSKSCFHFSLVFFIVVVSYILTEVWLFSSSDNCLYEEWLIPSDFTPSEPVDLSVYVDVRSNMKGDLEPVIVAEWKAKDDGGCHSDKS